MDTAEATYLLNFAYKNLGYSEVDEISIFNAKEKPGDIPENIWVEKGDWLALAYKIGAKKVFFMENNPVAVFAGLDFDDSEKLYRFYNKVWSMARPRLLFLAKPGELAVYDLAQKPPRSSSEFRKLKPFEIVRSATEVTEKLKRFRREELESGRVFEVEYRFGDIKNRADKALIRDLKQVRRELIKEGLGGKNLKYAHALIGRSIFIRYLEDRKILTERTFFEVAQQNVQWMHILENPPCRPGLDFSEKPSLYLRVLEDKDFTFNLFRKLTDDFNGDIFPDIYNEEKIVESRHLKLIQDLLFGESGYQKSLFFYAYQFEIIPIELISSIYEEFYHVEDGNGFKQGVFYTPPALVEFILTQTLTPERLATSPHIVDPACGSGIFLVESFRRIIRYRMVRQGRRLRFDELVKIIRDQLAGIDINPEAIRVAAFSLYLALLHYLEPPDIREQIERGNRLPDLVVNKNEPDSYNLLLSANAFDAEFIESNPSLKKQFSSSCADIVLGNPPWGSPGPKDTKARQQNQVAMEWCQKRELPVGDRERSQAFIWRSLDLLKPGGKAGLLVSTGVFFKHHKKSVAFRHKWLKQCKLDSVFNFAHTRHVFFKGVDSPFAAVIFHKDEINNTNYQLHYWSAKRTRTVEKLESVVFSRNDIKLLRPEDDLSNYKTWKIFWWGSHQDANLLQFINKFPSLINFTNPTLYGQGFEESGDKNEPEWLAEFREFPNRRHDKKFSRYGEIKEDWLVDIPKTVHRRGNKNIYNGLRILVDRGIAEHLIPKGQIIARFETNKYCFRNSIHGFRLNEDTEWKYKIILGILWSSLARYFFFLCSENWGIWHHEIHLKDELLSLPICLPQNESQKTKIIEIVDNLRNYNPSILDLVNPNGVPQDIIQVKRRELEAQLDEAIFKLYGLGEAEIDLIRDMCDTNLEFYYLREKSKATKSVLSAKMIKNCGTQHDLPDGTLGDYLRVFMQSWSPYLQKSTEFNWHIYLPQESSSMAALIFSINNIGERPIQETINESEAWENILHRLEDVLLYPISSRIYIDGLVRVVTDDEVIIIKRNEKRLWTKSMAREDAEATLVQAMNRDKMIKEQ